MINLKLERWNINAFCSIYYYSRSSRNLRQYYTYLLYLLLLYIILYTIYYILIPYLFIYIQLGIISARD
jgi:hypothetical protein